MYFILQRIPEKMKLRFLDVANDIACSVFMTPSTDFSELMEAFSKRTVSINYLKVAFCNFNYFSSSVCSSYYTYSKTNN